VYALAAMPASVAGVSVLMAFGGSASDAVVTSGAIAAIGVGMVITVAMVSVYVLALYLLREPELRALVHQVSSRRASQ
jgi:putative peptidoglycan lipid II flippase